MCVYLILFYAFKYRSVCVCGGGWRGLARGARVSIYSFVPMSQFRDLKEEGVLTILIPNPKVKISQGMSLLVLAGSPALS